MKNLTLQLTVDEANLILEGLGRLPFADVYALVANIQEQASQQLNGQEVKPTESAEMLRPPKLQEEQHEN